jgi:hypothetical protein
MNDDFYIGYLDQAPPALARYTRRVVVALGLVVLLSVAVIAARQRPADPGTFEFGITRQFGGVLREAPLPILRSVSSNGAVTNYLLVGLGKHGLPTFARGHDGERVRFQGSLIHRGGAVMIELNDAASFETLGRPPPNESVPRSETVGDVVLTGELVDTKCWFGVMRPAAGKVHRACAVRCLSGGVPPGLLVQDAQGNGVVVLLVGADPTPLRFNVQWAARIVTATGTLELKDEVPVLRVTSLALGNMNETRSLTK